MLKLKTGSNTGSDTLTRDPIRPGQNHWPGDPVTRDLETRFHLWLIALVTQCSVNVAPTKTMETSGCRKTVKTFETSAVFKTRLVRGSAEQSVGSGADEGAVEAHKNVRSENHYSHYSHLHWIADVFSRNWRGTINVAARDSWERLPPTVPGAVCITPS